MSTTSIRYIIGSPSFTSRITNLMLYNIICSTFDDFPYILSYFSKLKSVDYDVHFCDMPTDNCFHCGMQYMADVFAETLVIDDSPPSPPETPQTISIEDCSSLTSYRSAERSALYNWPVSMIAHICEPLALSPYLHSSGATLKHIGLGFETEEAIEFSPFASQATITPSVTSDSVYEELTFDVSSPMLRLPYTKSEQHPNS
ncbi:uncharacterized protein BT62DRAFT_1005045 [Guyanagaster necrorhizus]|uniref:Uncharacterized protein n=1 Tax=Guyanagaster necrorhizus TaxID=856835 RepID=A0A9P7VUZ9_9AGAR|nr:uncharacterized protein BT62DRAFT_1005045 [Guyanagaster necrorhizus MCA 3950]KAG7447429.1 hypothetical protein BT62DRAFT_1005045 [Guyanagaster necrorhizus MCA 3950]